MPRKPKTESHQNLPLAPSGEAIAPGAISIASSLLVAESENLDVLEALEATDSTPTSLRSESTDQIQTSPDLFPNGRTTTRMASALPIWEASSILTQRQDLPWANDADGKLRHTRTAENGQGAVHFWVTDNLDDESPATLAGAAALAMIDTFDIRAACMHLIYAAHAAQIDRPWEQEFIIDDKQIEEYLGLKKRTDKSKQQKLALIQEIAKQPCKITTFVSWPTQNRVKGFTLEEGRLWHLLGTRYHYQQDLFGNKELTGITFIVRAGLWARYFLNEEGERQKSALCEYATLSKSSLQDVMSVWQHREGAARLMVWLLFKTKADRFSPLPVETLMEIAFGTQQIELAKEDSQFRKKLVGMWDETLAVLEDRGWRIHFDPETYPPDLQPQKPKHSRLQSRPRGFFEQLLAARLWIMPQEDWREEALELEEDRAVSTDDHKSSEPEIQFPQLTGTTVKSCRIARGWSQRKLASLTGLSQGLISQLENGGRTITPENQLTLQRIFMLNE
jgi:DNA-binding XRE family transcriptional regulator